MEFSEIFVLTRKYTCQQARIKIGNVSVYAAPRPSLGKLICLLIQSKNHYFVNN